MKIGTKIILGFSAPILMFIAFGIWLQLVTAGISDNLKHVRDESVAFALVWARRWNVEPACLSVKSHPVNPLCNHLAACAG